MGRSTFRQADLTRALKGAQGAGLDAGEVRIEPDGAIRILIHRAPPDDVDDIRREIEGHFRGKA